MVTRLGRLGRVATAALVVALAATLAGCGEDDADTRPGSTGTSSSSTDDGGQMDPEMELRDRPTLDASDRDYRRLLVGLRAALARESAAVTWDDGPPTEDPASLCPPPFHTVDGAASHGFFTGGVGAVADDEWEALAGRAASVLEREGWTGPEVVKDVPGEHVVTFRGPYDAVLQLGATRNTTISLTGGCFLEESSGS